MRSDPLYHRGNNKYFARASRGTKFHSSSCARAKEIDVGSCVERI